MENDVKVKICGITNSFDISYLNEYKPDFAGFVIFQKSKRYVSVEKASELMKGLDKSIKRVAVTVSPDINLVGEIESAGFDIIQIHGKIDETVIEQIKLPIWYAYNISDSNDLEQLSFIDRIDAIVVDSEKYGSGKTFDWNVNLDSIKKPLVLAGGLNPENVKTGINIFSPYAVDVSSGVEGDFAEGKTGKDKEKIRTFIERVRTNE